MNTTAPALETGLYLTIDHTPRKKPFLIVDYFESLELMSYRETNLLPRVPKEQTHYTPEQLETARKLAQMVLEKMDKPNSIFQSETSESLTVRLSEKGATAVKQLLEEHKLEFEWREGLTIAFVLDGKNPAAIKEAIRKYGTAEGAAS